MCVLPGDLSAVAESLAKFKASSSSLQPRRKGSGFAANEAISGDERMRRIALFASFETTPLNRRAGGELSFPICQLSDADYSKAVIHRVKRNITRQRHSPRCCRRTKTKR
jgi:hypothetical protein